MCCNHYVICVDVCICVCLPYSALCSVVETQRETEKEGERGREGASKDARTRTFLSPFLVGLLSLAFCLALGSIGRSMDPSAIGDGYPGWLDIYV